MLIFRNDPLVPSFSRSLTAEDRYAKLRTTLRRAQPPSRAAYAVSLEVDDALQNLIHDSILLTSGKQLLSEQILLCSTQPGKAKHKLEWESISGQVHPAESV